MLIRFCIIHVIVCCTATLAHAVLLPVANHSFEDIASETPVNEFTFGPLTGWDLYEETSGLISGGTGGSGFFIGTLTPQLNTDTPDPDDLDYFPNGGFDGQRVGIAFNFGDSGGGPDTGDLGEYGLQQTLSTSIAANTSYTLQVEIGNITTGTSPGGTFPLLGFPGYRIALLADGVEFAADENGLTFADIPEGEFRTATLNYVTGASDPEIGATLGIRLVNLNDTTNIPSGNDIEVDFDNVRLDATVIPEPAMIAMFVGAMSLIVAVLRRRCH